MHIHTIQESMAATALYLLSNPVACQLTQYDICMKDLNKEHHIMLCDR